MLLIVMQSAHLVAQRKAFQQSMEDVLTLSREQTSSQPLIASALEELKVLVATPERDSSPPTRETFNDRSSVQSALLSMLLSKAAVCPDFHELTCFFFFFFSDLNQKLFFQQEINEMIEQALLCSLTLVNLLQAAN